LVSRQLSSSPSEAADRPLFLFYEYLTGASGEANREDRHIGRPRTGAYRLSPARAWLSAPSRHRQGGWGDAGGLRKHLAAGQRFSRCGGRRSRGVRASGVVSGARSEVLSGIGVHQVPRTAGAGEDLEADSRIARDRGKVERVRRTKHRCHRSGGQEGSGLSNSFGYGEGNETGSGSVTTG